MAMLVAGVKHVREIGREMLQAMGGRGAELHPGGAIVSDAQIEEYIRARARSFRNRAGRLADAHAHRSRPYRPLSPLTAPVRHSRIRRAAGSYVGTMYHPACTCRVGRADDRGAVLDEQMRVRGASRLRVADASAMPEIVGANTNATCIALGEKVADLVAREA